MRLTAGSASGATSGSRILYQRLSCTCWMAPAALSDTLNSKEPSRQLMTGTGDPSMDLKLLPSEQRHVAAGAPRSRGWSPSSAFTGAVNAFAYPMTPHSKHSRYAPPPDPAPRKRRERFFPTHRR